MESKRAISLVEIGESEVRFLVGISLQGVPEVLFLKRVPLSKGAVKEGLIKDRPAVIEAVKKATSIEDEAVARKVDSSITSLLLPPVGFKIYSCEKNTTVVAANNMIDRVDVSNVLSLVNKEKVPNGNDVVEIVPEVFYLEDGRMFAAPPIGSKSAHLGVRAQVHTLPGEVVHAYRSLLEEAGIRTSRLSVSTAAVSNLVKSYRDLPQAYFLVDLGAGTTKVALIGNGEPISSVLFPYGGKDIDEAMASALGLDTRSARYLKERYGYRSSKRREADVTLDNGASVKLEDVYEALKVPFLSYDKYISNSILTIERDYGGSSGRLGSLPLIFVGGLSALHGIGELLPKTLSGRKSIFLVPRSIGARDPSLAAMLGFIASEAAYRSAAEEEGVGVGSLSRLSRS